MADIFVSYSRSDKARVAPLVAALEAHGWSVWWDPAVTPGDEFDALIGAELEAAGAVVVVWSPASVESRWVKGEARDAADRGVLVPVRFENARLPIDVRAIHTIDLDDWAGRQDGASFKALCTALEAKVKRAPERGGAQRSKERHAPVTICVLPFGNMSGDPEQEYFSDGITEDIITDLGRISALSVVSRNTAFALKGAATDLARVARQTKAAHVLVGSVRKAGSRVRITAQLVAAANDQRIWGDRYDRDLNDIFAVQDEISRAIVAALKLTLLPEEKQALEQRGTTNPEAYKLYLMARQFWLSDNERYNEIVVRICNRAIGIDPNYAQAWATMALALGTLYWMGDSMDDGERAALTALRLDPNLADAHAAMGEVYRSRGRYQEGLTSCRNALRLEPDSYSANREAGMCCLGLRQHDEAIAYFELAAAAMESEFTAATFISQCYKAKGDAERTRGAARRTLDRIEKIVAAEPAHSRAIGMGVAMLAALNEKERAKEWATRALLVDPDNVNLQYNLACSMAGLGDLDATLEILAAIGANTEFFSRGMLSWMESDPDFDSVRAEPRFQAVVEEIRARAAATNTPKTSVPVA